MDISPNVEVHDNVVRNNANGITGIQQARGNNQGAYGTLRVENLYVHDNVIEVGEGAVTGIGDDTGSSASWNSLNNRFEDNTYILTTGNAEHFGWDDEFMNWSEWLATGNGSGSTWSN